MTIDHVIFDLDGTLIDSAAICADILDEMLRDRGDTSTVSRAKARDYASHGGTRMVAGLLGNACGDPQAELAEFRRRYAMRDTPPDCLFGGVRAGLARLRDRGLTLSICSNKPQNLCEKVLADLGLADFFGVVVGGSAGFRPKPHPDLMVEALARLGVSSDRCIFVGDSEVDHALSIACEIPFLFVTYGYATVAWQAKDLRCHDHFDGVIDDILIGGHRSGGSYRCEAAA